MTYSIFEAYGFERVADGLWLFEKNFEADPDNNEGESKKAIVVVEEQPEGHFIGYIGEPFEGGVPKSGLRFSSRDIRDMILLAQNEVASACVQNTGIFSNDGFMDNEDDIFITMPFMSDPWSDYAITTETKQEDDYHELVDPSAVYANYTAWREEFCEKILSSTKTPTA